MLRHVDWQTITDVLMQRNDPKLRGQAVSLSGLLSPEDGDTYPSPQNVGRLTINPLTTKRRLLYLKTQFLPRCKHFSTRL